MKLGDGQTNLNENGKIIIHIPEHLLIQKSNSPLLSLVHFAYPQNVLNMICETLFDDAAILCPTIEVVKEINDFILSLIDVEEKIYFTLDTPCEYDEDNDIQRMNLISSDSTLPFKFQRKQFSIILCFAIIKIKSQS